MIALALALIAMQSSPSVSTQQQPDQKVIVNKLPNGVGWKSRSAAARRMHAEASVQALKINPFFGNCKEMTVDAFENAFALEVEKSPESPTITNAALAAYSVCPTGGE